MDFHAHHSFPTKVYLSGSDYFHLLLQKKPENHVGEQNIIRLKVDFEHKNCLDQFIQHIQSSPIIHWMCNITLHHSTFLSAPYWFYQNKNKSIQIKEHPFEENQQIPKSILQQGIRINIDPLIQIDIFHTPTNQSTLVISWHHLLMDGRGAGLLIRHVNSTNKDSHTFFQDFFPKPQTSISFWAQLKNIFFIRYFMEEAVRGTLLSMPIHASNTKPQFILKSIHLNREETSQLDKTAQAKGAKFGATLFLLACCAQLFYALPSIKNQSGTIWVPLPYDGRKRGSLGPMITNCISFLFYRIDTKNIESLEETIKDLQRQMSEQIGSEIPKKYHAFLHSMKRIPVKFTQILMSKYTQKASPSFLFTAAGQENWDTQNLFKEGVSLIQIIPPFVFPQGLTFSFLRYNNQLTMNIVFEESRLSSDEINLLEQKIQALFSIHSKLA